MAMIPKVLAVVGDNDGCALWRIFQPFGELQRQGFAAEWGYRTDAKLAGIVHKFDAVIVPRLHWPVEEQDQADRWFNALHAAGKAVIFEVDDDMFSDDFYRRLVVLHGKEVRAAEEVLQSVLYTLQSSDGATVSSQRLATIVRRYTDKPVHVVPNYMDLKWFRAVQAKSERKVKGLCIGWAGGLRPDSDVEQMAIAWGRIAQRYPHVTFFVQGHHAEVITRNIPADRLKSSDWLPIEAYPLPLVNVDIGCCPLSDTGFNRAKTYIKAMEYAVSGAAVVASPTVYGQIIEDGYDGYIVQTVDEWEDRLARLIESSNLRNRLQQRLLSKVETQHSLEANAWRWVAAWSDIIEKYRARIVVPTAEQVRVYA
jgi:glycosyltransferase involved in cell wall biosynthesis